MSYFVSLALALVSMARPGHCQNDTSSWLSARKSGAIQVLDAVRPSGLIVGQAGQRVQLYLVHSAALDVGADGAKADLFVASLSNIVYPAVTYAYFSAESDYSLSSENSESTVDFSVGASASGMAIVFTRLFQFTDEDQDGEFTKDIDTEKDEHVFMESKGGLVFKFPYPKPMWDAGDFSGDTKTMKIQTKDGMFAVTLKANEEVGRTPGGSKKTPMSVKMDVDINYPGLQEGNLVGLEAYVVATEAAAEADVKATAQVGNGVFSKQPDNLPSLGLAWDGQATVETEGDVEVKASGMVDATIDDIKFADCIKGGIGVKANGNAKLSVKQITYTFKSSTAGKIIWDPVVGTTSAEEQAPPTPEDQQDPFMSGAGGVAWHALMLLAAFLPTTLSLLNVVSAAV